ncbi:MAG: hypothetical protein MUC49_00895 [Raineya sp.]|nr:hypothetical protein [Raineya sp.]
MKKLLFFSLLLIPLGLLTTCKNKGILEKKCTKACRCDYGLLKFALFDKDGKDYLEFNPNLNYENVSIYDENWNYATIGGKSWELNQNAQFLSSPLYVDYMYVKDVYGLDKIKTFYVKLDKDIDTIRVEYKQKNGCMYMDYMRIFYNQELILEDYEDTGLPTYTFKITK